MDEFIVPLLKWLFSIVFYASCTLVAIGLLTGFRTVFGMLRKCSPDYLMKRRKVEKSLGFQLQEWQAEHIFQGVAIPSWTSVFDANTACVIGLLLDQRGAPLNVVDEWHMMQIVKASGGREMNPAECRRMLIFLSTMLQEGGIQVRPMLVNVEEIVRRREENVS